MKVHNDATDSCSFVNKHHLTFNIIVNKHHQTGEKQDGRQLGWVLNSGVNKVLY